MIDYVHYNETIYCQSTLKEAALLYVKSLPKDVTCLVSRGESGLALCLAILLLAKRPLRHFHVRKPNQAHTTRPFTGDALLDKDVLCFVDDFIETGITFQACVQVIPPAMHITYALLSHKVEEPCSITSKTKIIYAVERRQS